MELIKLSPTEFPLFERVSQSEPEKYHFLQMDKILYPEDVHIYLVVDKKNIIQAMVGDYPNWEEIHLIGNEDAIKSIINKVNLDRNRIFFPKKLYSYFHELMLPPHLFEDHIRYLHDKESFGSKRPQKGILKKLTDKDTLRIQNVLCSANPELWRDYIPKFHGNRFWFGLEGHEGKLISVAGGWIECNTSFFVAIATHQNYQRRGYAYDMLSQLISVLYNESKNVLVETTRDNTAACALYEQLGFLPKYEFMVIHKKPT